jgi:gliding motility-associated-like protein
MRKQFVLILSSFVIILFFTSNLLAQERDCNYKKPHQADTWLFGKKARITFKQDPPIVLPTSIEFAMPSSVSLISDENGDLLLFTNGKTIWDKTYNVMDNGQDLDGALLGGQTSVIIPHPGNSKQYFVFTTNMFLTGILTKGINYTTVDFTNNSNGSVLSNSKNNFLFNENSKTVCAVKHENNRDYWVIFHGFGPNKGNNYYSYLVDTSGVVSTPVESAVGFNQIGDLNNQVGYMKASSNGERVAVTLPEDGVIEVLDFDRATGKLSNAITSNTGSFYMPFGLEFSPDNSKLYATTTPLVGGTTSDLYQFDITVGQPFVNPIVISQFDYNATQLDSTMQGLQLGVDGKIYLTKMKQSGVELPNLSVIYNPDRNGLACNYNELEGVSNNGLYLEGAGSQGGLPDFMSDFLNIPHFFYLNQCQNDTTNFEIRNKANANADWDFKDPSGTPFLDDLMKPGYIFSDAGTYNVELTESYNGEDYIFTEEVIINPLPSIEIGQGYDTLYILPNSSVRLDAGAGYDIYNWMPNTSSGQYMDVNQEGLYKVSVTDINCCTNSDVVFVKYAQLSYPTAFNPASNYTENRTFKVLGNVSAISKYQFNIFNRWGQLVFESDDPTVGWDGSYEGSAAPNGTYVYSSVFTSFESGIQSSIDIKTTGTATLIR